MADEDAAGVFFHFPPPPTHEPADERRRLAGPPVCARVTDDQAKYLSSKALAEKVLERADNAESIFGFLPGALAVEKGVFESRRRLLLLRLHPDKAGGDARIGAAYLVVQNAAAILRAKHGL